MSRYNRYARELDSAFKKARDEYKAAYGKLQAAEKADSYVGQDVGKRAQAAADLIKAKEDFRVVGTRVWEEFNRTRDSLRVELEKEVRADGAVDPDAIDQNGLKLLEMGDLSADDFYALAEKYSDNLTMLRFVGKYAKDRAADLYDNPAERASLNLLAADCASGRVGVLKKWDDISGALNYCSGQAHRNTSPSALIKMADWWEKLSAEAVESF